MNENQFDAQLDRLVDGELSATEYRELLTSLDDEPDGWRRCATAFLEAQAWGQELAGLVAEKRDVDPPVILPKRASYVSMLAVAASFLIAFGLGIYVRGWVLSPALPDVVENKPTVPETKIVETPSTDDQEPVDENQPAGNVRFVVDENVDAFDVPFYEVDQMKPEWLDDDLFMMPPGLVEQLNRIGHEVRSDRRLVPVDLENGRRVVIPVDQFEIVPVSQNFQ